MLGWVLAPGTCCSRQTRRIRRPEPEVASGRYRAAGHTTESDLSQAVVQNAFLCGVPTGIGKIVLHGKLAGHPYLPHQLTGTMAPTAVVLPVRLQALPAESEDPG